MKLKSLIIVCFLAVSSIMAQDMNVLKVEALKAYKAGASMNYDAIFETTYPKVFEIIPKEQMKQMMEQMMETEQFAIKMVETTPNFTFGEIKKIGKKSFCMIDHDNVMRMTFVEPMGDDVNMMIDIFKTSMDATEVTFDEATNSFTIKLRATLIAVADEVTNNKWKFLNKDKENRLFAMIFDEETQKALGL